MLTRASVAALAVLCASACGAATPRDRGTIVDDAGRPVRLSGTARRIISLSPATTELLFALGAGNRVVGRTRWCSDPEPARAVPSVGDGLNPNLEVLLARNPDLVVLYDSPTNAVARERLTALGVATATVRLDGIDDLPRAARLLGALTGTGPAADSLVRAFEGELATLRQERRSDGPTVLLLAWDDPPIVVGRGSFLSEIVELAGARNVFADLAQPSATVSLEAIAARQPDLVLLTGGDEEASVTARPEWHTVHAVRDRRFARVDGTEFSHPSFRIPDAVRRLRRALETAP